MTLIDLTYPITPELPVYPGDPPLQIGQSGSFEVQGFNDHKVSFGTHIGTHIDAPAHMIAGGKQLKDYPPERFMCTATCLDVRYGFHRDVLEKATITPGMAVLFYTGASDYFHHPRYWQTFEVMQPDFAQLLIERQVSLVGLDTASADREHGFPIHKKLLGADILIIENLTKDVSELANKTFELIALPLKLEDDGAPVHAIARLQT